MHLHTRKVERMELRELIMAQTSVHENRINFSTR